MGSLVFGQQSFGSYLIAAVAVVGAETRQLRKEHEEKEGCGIKISML